AMVCAQHFPNAKRTQVAIVDTGVGFRTSFEASPAYPGLKLSDREALKLGLAPYVTSKPNLAGEPYASPYGRLGVGLFIVSEILRRVGGKLLVGSGQAILARTPAQQRWYDVNRWHGAIVGFEVPDSPLVSYRDATAEARRLAKERKDGY
ncbi:MAG TPA: ATP-binding protein, partial [Myxococcales bacterium]|nr:ATP-binding protein [Myxococcales bacterium]